ncbi:MAG: hypothetical protein GX962_03050 [Epulopiscium sp.]|nr:hypothetical protein [Candidatus Epulonipiscium sp.]
MRSIFASFYCRTKLKIKNSNRQKSDFISGLCLFLFSKVKKVICGYVIGIHKLPFLCVEMIETG